MTNSGVHYDGVTNLFESILGENLHVGYFDNAKPTLQEASVALTQFMIDQVKLGSNSQILDVGCGVGGPARYLAANYDAKVVGISNSQECIQRASDIQQANVSYQCFDATELSISHFKNFDVAWLLESSHLMADKNSLFQGLNAVTSSSGRFVLCDFFLKDEKFATDRRNILKMRKIYKVFGRLHLTLPAYYQKKALDNGFLNTTVKDITEKTYPTLDIWLQEAENQSNNLHGKNDFIEGVNYLRELYQQEVVSYHVISGEKT